MQITKEAIEMRGTDFGVADLGLNLSPPALRQVAPLLTPVPWSIKWGCAQALPPRRT